MPSLEDQVRDLKNQVREMRALLDTSVSPGARPVTTQQPKYPHIKAKVTGQSNGFYSWSEYTFDSSGNHLVLPEGRSGNSTYMYAVERNNLGLAGSLPIYVDLEECSYVAGVPTFEFDRPYELTTTDVCLVDATSVFDVSQVFFPNAHVMATGGAVHAVVQPLAACKSISGNSSFNSGASSIAINTNPSNMSAYPLPWIVPGMAVSGSGIATGTFVTGVSFGGGQTGATLSQPTTSNESNTSITFAGADANNGYGLGVGGGFGIGAGGGSIYDAYVSGSSQWLGTGPKGVDAIYLGTSSFASSLVQDASLNWHELYTGSTLDGSEFVQGWCVSGPTVSGFTGTIGHA